MGNKKYFVDQFHGIESHLPTGLSYFEPFLGSGVIFLNTNKTYDSYTINDINPHIVKMYRSMQLCDYDVYVRIVDDIKSRFGNIKDDIDAYYGFRDWYNVNKFNKGSDDEGLYIKYTI